MDIIIGTGATGLTYASLTNNEHIVLEADSEIGGYCKTIKQDGFTWDYSGHFFHFQDKSFEDYICKYINKDTLLECRKNTQINYKNSYVDFPFQKNIHQLEKEELIDCLYDLFNNEFDSYSNFKEMLFCKFGKSIAEKFLIPYNEKLYACDLNKLDVDAMGRFFPFANKEEIIANFKAKDNDSYNSTFTYPKGGAIEYINSLNCRVDQSKIYLNEAVVSINLTDKTVRTSKGREINYDNLISTIPFPKLLELSSTPHNTDVFSYNKVLVFNLGFDSKGNDIKNNWVYFSDKNLTFYRIGYYDNIFGDDRMSLYVEVGFDKDADIDVESTKAQVIEDLKTAKIITTQKLISSHSVIMNPAYVHITEKSIKEVNKIKNELSTYDVYSIGRYGSWTYCSIEDGMIEAKELASKL